MTAYVSGFGDAVTFENLLYWPSASICVIIKFIFAAQSKYTILCLTTAQMRGHLR